MIEESQLDPLEAPGYWVNYVATRLRLCLQRRTLEFGCTVPQAALLLGCYVGGAETPGDLQRISAVDPGSVTRTLDRLEAQGLIKRKPHPTDRRSVRVLLTASGRKLAPKLLDVALSTNSEFRQGIRDEDIVQCLQTLQKMLRNAQELCER